jgi:hypothetical protein
MLPCLIVLSPGYGYYYYYYLVKALSCGLAVLRLNSLVDRSIS